MTERIRKTAIICGALAFWLFGTFGIIVWHISVVERAAPVTLPSSSFFLDFWDNHRVRLRGTWVMENEESAFPLQTSEISCDIDYCYEALAEQIGSPGNPQISASLYKRKVTRWDSQFLTYEDSAICTDYNYTLDRKNKTLIGIRTTKNPLPAGCDHTSKQDIHIAIKDGFPVYLKLQQEAARGIRLYTLLFFSIWSSALIFVTRRTLKSYRKVPDRS